MAADVCSEISSFILTSPRISFSHDLNTSDTLPPDHRRQDSPSTSDFNFSIIHNTFIQQLSSADELFADGKILPTQIKKITPTNPIPLPFQIQIPHIEDSKKKRLKELLFEETEKPSSKSFWQFTRSSSLNCDNGRSKGFIKSLQILSRSNSTGSALNQKQMNVPKMSAKQSLSTLFTRNSSVSFSSSSGSYYFYDSSSKRAPLKKNCKDYGGGIRISPVLNISHGAVCLFGFGSFFCNGKSKKKRK